MSAIRIFSLSSHNVSPSIGRIKRSFERRVRASTDFRMPAMASVCFSLLLVRTAPAIRGKNGVGSFRSAFRRLSRDSCRRGEYQTPAATRPNFGHLGRVACGAEAAVRSTTNVWRLRFRWRNLILYLVAQSRPTGPTMEYLHRYAAMQHRPTWCAAHLRDPDNDQSHVVRISNDATSCSRLQNSMLQGTIA